MILKNSSGLLAVSKNSLLRITIKVLACSGT